MTDRPAADVDRTAEAMRLFLSASSEQREAAFLLMGWRMVDTGKDLLGLKLLKGAAVLTRLNISEFHAHALIDVCQYFLHARYRMPRMALKDLLLAMDDVGLFDRVNIRLADLERAIPESLRQDLATATAKFKTSRENTNDQRP